MQPKNSIYLRILEKYGFIIDDSGDSPINISRLPAVKEKETLKQWKQRVFKDANADISVYAFYEPAPQTRISTLIRDSGSEHLNRLIRHYGRLKDKKQVEAIEDTKKLYSTLPKETLSDFLYEFEGELQPSVKEFFKVIAESTDEEIDIEKLLKELTKVYNYSVTAYKAKDAYINQCIKYGKVPTNEQNRSITGIAQLGNTEVI